MIFEALEEYDINQFEYAFLTTDTHHSNGTLAMNIPKLMPLIAMAKPKSTNVVFNNNIFINDAACKPVAKASIATLNYLTVPRFKNSNFQPKANAAGIVKAGAKFICCVMDKNIKDIYLTDHI